MRYYIFKLPFNNPNWNRPQEQIDLKDFVPVWTGTADEFKLETDDNYELLERIFEKFNVNIPEGYAASSLSVGDVVLLEEKFISLRKYYCCDMIGWKEVQLC